MNAEEIESIISQLGFDWSNHFNSYEEYMSSIEEVLLSKQD